MKPEKVYFDIVKRYEHTSEEDLLKELVRVANLIKDYRPLFSKVVASKVATSHLATMVPLIDDSKRSDLVKDQLVLRSLIYIDLVTVIAMGSEDYVTLTPMGRLVCILMMQQVTQVTDRNTKLQRMLELVNLNAFSDYMEEQYNESVLELKFDILKDQVVYRRIVDGSVKVANLDVDPSKLLDIQTTRIFKDIETFLKLYPQV